MAILDLHVKMMMKNVASWIDLALDGYRIPTYLLICIKFLSDLIFYAFTFSDQPSL
jgi:hypothetical protein